MNFEVMVALVGFFASISSIVFAYLAFKRSERKEHKSDGKTEGVMFSNIGHIKACVDRVEKNLTKVDEKYSVVLERLSRTEESLDNLKKQVTEICKIKNNYY